MVEPSDSIVRICVADMLLHYGEDSQIDVAIEEMSELTKELVKYKRSKVHFREKLATSKEKVLDEMADVSFMMEYLRVIFQISDDEIKKRVEEKAARTLERYVGDMYQ